MNYYVYALIDTINRLPFYIGKGKNKRAWTHLKGHANYNQQKLDYIKTLRSLNQEPDVIIIKSNLNNKEALEWEKDIIKLCNEHSISLTNKNITPPDRTGCKLSARHKEILRDVNKGKKLSVDHRLKIGKSNQHQPVININKAYVDRSTRRNEGSKNPNAQKIAVGNMVFNCLKHACEFYNVSLATFKKRYDYARL